MKIRFVKSLFVGIKEGEVKDLPLYLAQIHIEKGEAEEVKEDEPLKNDEAEVKVKRQKKEKNEEI